MPRRHWDELSDAVRREVERHTGPIHAAYVIPNGASCDVAAILDTATGRVFWAGRHPDLAPGSPNLALLAALLGDLGRWLTPGLTVEVPRFADRWRGLIAPELVDGDSLLHTDMTPRNLLLSEGGAGGVRLVDWSGPARGAAWIDTALLLHRLIRADHTPAAAEEWAARVPAYARAPEHAVTAFADVLVSLWQRKQRASPEPHHGPLLDAARRWAAHR